MCIARANDQKARAWQEGGRKKCGGEGAYCFSNAAWIFSSTRSLTSGMP